MKPQFDFTDFKKILNHANAMLNVNAKRYAKR